MQTRLQMTFTKPQNVNTSGKKVFLNASQNTDGNTAKMAKELFGNEKYTQINLSEYNIPQVGQGDGDYQKVFDQLKGAKVIVIGTPVYWSNMSGYLKTFMDHMNINSELKGADLYTIVQGADSDQSAAIQSTYGSLNRIARRFELNFVGVGSNNSDMKVLHNQLVGE
ncbi:flavodoxin family protein [Convivina praedatoris]|uniref:flavodoxin family protein n=1 Tax=Convivina praedatoris TaxID=2880963 RepID=UPI00200BE63B|nr:flavodoxin family protein [Convivina sp. LMG 32447]